MKSTAGGLVKQWLGASVLAVSGLALLPLSVAQAQEQQSAQFNFALAAKPLPQALSDFSRVTGISVIYTDEEPYGLSAPAVSGQMSATQALQRRGSSLRRGAQCRKRPSQTRRTGRRSTWGLPVARGPVA